MRPDGADDAGEERRGPPEAPAAADAAHATDATKEAEDDGMPTTVLMDANALMIPFQFHVNVEAEVERVLEGDYQIKVPSNVVDELEDLAENLTGQDQWAAKMALKLADKFDVLKTDTQGDPGILELAEKEGAVVVTNDRLLRARLRAKNIPVLFLRSKAYLALEGFLG